MTEEKKPESVNVVCENEDEIDLLELAKTIWMSKKLIIWIVVCLTVATIIISLFMTNIYTAKAVIKPISQTPGSGKLSSLAAQFGGLASMAGLAMPTSASSTEIVSLLKSNILKKEIIEQHQLLPVLFSDNWDEEKKAWKKPGFNPLSWMAKLRPTQPNARKKEPGIPDTWDGIRELENIVKIDYNMKEDIITLTVNFRDPEMAARIANYFVVSLNNHMSSEAKRIALTNREYLEKQLRETNDLIVQQKIYNLIAEKIETMMMAEVKEGYAFKVLDPPMAPDKKSKPKRSIMVIVSFFASLFIGVFMVLFREYLKKIRVKPAGGQNA